MRRGEPTIAVLNEELSNAGRRLINAQNDHWSDTEYLRLLKIAEARRGKAQEEAQPRIDVITAEIEDLKQQIRDRQEQCARKRKSTWVPPENWTDRLRKFLSSISRGVDWNVSPYTQSKKHWQVRWMSPGKRYVIITRPGGNYSSGQSRPYGQVDHWLVDLNRYSENVGRKGMELQRHCTIMEFEGGKLTRDRKKKMIDLVRSQQKAKEC